MKVREVIRLLDRDGWVQVRQTGSHRQFRHSGKPGTVTVAGGRNEDLAIRTIPQHLQASRLEEVRMLSGYLVLVEDAGSNFSAYSPDLPGCIAAAATIDETVALMREAIAFHLEGMRMQGEPIPEPHANALILDAA